MGLDSGCKEIPEQEQILTYQEYEFNSEYGTIRQKTFSMQGQASLCLNVWLRVARALNSSSVARCSHPSRAFQASKSVGPRLRFDIGFVASVSTTDLIG